MTFEVASHVDNYREAPTWERGANTKMGLGLRMSIWPKQIYDRVNTTILEITAIHHEPYWTKRDRKGTRLT